MRVCASLTLTFIAIALGFAPGAGAAEPAAAAPAAPETIKVGIMQGMFRGVPEGLIQAGGQQFSGLFKTIVGLPGEAAIEPDHTALAKKLAANQLHLGVVHGFEWAWIQKEYPQMAPLVVAIPSQLPQACIVVNAKESCEGPHALKGANIDVPFNMKAHGFAYIEKLEKTVPAGAFKVNASEDMASEEGLDEVGKGRAKAVLVDAGAFAAYQKNNPGKAGRVKLLCKSEPFPQTVLIYNKKNLPDSVVKQLQQGLQNATKNPQGKAFLFMWNLKGFETSNAAFDDLVRKSLAAFPPPEKK